MTTKHPTWTEHKGFWISIYPEYEPTESRLARGDWQSRVKGYFYRIRRKGITKHESTSNFSSYEHALNQAKGLINFWETNCLSPVTNEQQSN